MSARGGHSQGVASASSMQPLNKGLGKGTPLARGKGTPLASIRRGRARHGGNLESNMRHPISVLAAIPVEALKDRRAASRSRSPRAPRTRGPSQMQNDALEVSRTTASNLSLRIYCILLQNFA